MSDADLTRARAEAAAAREQLLSSAHALQTRLKPAALASDAWLSARDAGEMAASRVAQGAAQRPLAASAAAVGLAIFVVRKPIVRLFGRLRRNKH